MYTLFVTTPDWKDELLALLTGLVVFVYGPPHACLNIFIGILLLELAMNYNLHKKSPLKTTSEFIQYSISKLARYSVLIFIGNGFDIFLNNAPSTRNYMLFALFVIETTQIFSLIAAMGHSKEINLIKLIYSTVIKKNPLGEILKEIGEKEDTDEKNK
ncbi:hypothetical protein ACFC9N_11420 [Enterococcus casseliflavus]|uniref:hypothetical protein n=1 Tax=Enterococcus casseliflavus TaxID=37734 RepID=UPI0039A65CCE